MHYFRFHILGLMLIALTFATLIPQAQAVQKTDEVYRQASESLLENGYKALEENKLSDALTMFESALVANPGNVEALVAIGRTHEALGQRSTGLGYYRRALTVEPENRAALAAESLAFLADHGLIKAEENRDRLKRLCARDGCPELQEVDAAIKAYKAKTAEDPESSQDKS